MNASERDLTPTTTYRDHLAAGSLTFQRCRSCGSAIFYPRVVCPACGGTDLALEVSAGVGTVYSTTVIPRRDEEPYCVCLIDLHEGYRMMSTVVDMPAADVHIGMAVEVRIERDGEAARAVFVAGSAHVSE
jgi:uncharacterized OB-fold protein